MWHSCKLLWWWKEHRYQSLEKGYNLSAIGDLYSLTKNIIQQANVFVLACYGIKNTTDMSNTRLLYLFWGKNTKGHSSSPNLSALPLREAFFENVKRVHLQTLIWQDLNVVRGIWVDKYCKTRFEPNTFTREHKGSPTLILYLLK